MPYKVTIPRRARQALDRIPASYVRRILEAIALLGYNPRPSGSRQLTNSTHWRIRIGDYRVVYDIDDASQTVTVVTIGHRRDVYR